MIARGLIGTDGRLKHGGGSQRSSTSASILMIAPTTSLVASVAMEKDAALRITNSTTIGSSSSIRGSGSRGGDGIGNGDYSFRDDDDDEYDDGTLTRRDRHNNHRHRRNIHVVHGTVDIVFCPNQRRWRINDPSTTDAIDNTGSGGSSSSTGTSTHTSTRIALHRIHDNHIFSKQASQRKLYEIVTELLVG